MSQDADQIMRQKLLDWYRRNKRTMPWRDQPDPYRIWVSEIMLQQTRVDQARPYFDRFIEHFPTVYDLAGADQQDVLRVWEGLGYYSRARNLHEAAQTVVDDFDGKIPETYDGLLELKGVGPYTAAAIASIAFEKPQAAVDGNVIRVLSRIYGIEDDVSRSPTKRSIQELADELIDPDEPGDFNQALMEMGATTCTPKNPDCARCPVQEYCTAHRTAKTDVIPYKASKKKIPHKQIGVGIIEDKDGHVLIAKRPEDAMLGGLWEFPGGKQKKGEKIEDTVVRELKEELGVDVHELKPFMKLDHTYSHFKITLHAYRCSIKNGIPKANDSQEICWVSRQELENYPFPKANRKLTEKLVNDDQHELDL